MPYAPQDEGVDQLDSLGEGYEYVPDDRGDLRGVYAFHTMRLCPQADCGKRYLLESMYCMRASIRSSAIAVAATSRVVKCIGFVGPYHLQK